MHNSHGETYELINLALTYFARKVNTIPRKDVGVSLSVSQEATGVISQTLKNRVNRITRDISLSLIFYARVKSASISVRGAR